jgi:hypothetical protein
MEDFDALAAALGAGIADIRGCLILSRDGLVLAGHPNAAEQELKAAWLRFAALGEPERGFVQFGTEIWSYARRGAYASFAVTGIGVRPGLVIDHMEQMLLGAEASRSKGDGPKVDAPAPAPSSPPASAKRKRRSALHGDPASIEEPVVIHAEGPTAQTAFEAAPSASEAASQGQFEEVEPEPEGPFEEGDPEPEGPLEEPDPGAEPPFEEPDPGADPSSGEGEEAAAAASAVGREASDEGDEVDRFSLATEFAGLLQDEPDDADA